MAKIIETASGNGSKSYRIILPKELAEEYIKKHGKNITIKKLGEGFKLSPILKEVKGDK